MSEVTCKMAGSTSWALSSCHRRVRVACFPSWVLLAAGRNTSSSVSNLPALLLPGSRVRQDGDIETHLSRGDDEVERSTAAPGATKET